MKRFIISLLMSAAVIYMGCSDDTQTPQNPTDTTVANFNNLVIAERTVPFDTALSGVDFYNGLIVRDSSRYKDANLVDSLFVADSAYYFRSGDLSDIRTNSVPGYRTRFKIAYPTLTQAEFDTVKVIPDSDTSLTENDFTMDNTESFRAPLVLNTVYGFYLKGKFDNGLTTKPVFGLLYLETAYYDGTGFKLRFDVKINKAGENRFKSQ